MQFTSVSFLLFACLSLLLYFTVPKRIQWWVLLAFSVVFYALSGIENVIFILYTALITYVTAIFLQKKADNEDDEVEANRENWSKQERKQYRAKAKKKRFHSLIVGLLLGFGMLGVLKYTAFVMDSARSVWVAFGGKSFSIPSLLLPLGISFYTFQSMGYLIDVYRKKVRAEQNPAKLLLFVSYFPQLLQGPISRFGDLQEQLIGEHHFDGLSFRSGLLRVLWGYFKKMVLADTALLAVKTLVDKPEQYSGIYVVLLILLYSAQIYGDFTGGIDITIGLSEMMGIRLTENFNRPFSSRSTKEYWNRWHITMGSWFTDYVFYPLSVSAPMQKLSDRCCRVGIGFGMRIPVYLATVATWFLTGLWHGAGWNFIVWGLLNCLVILLSRELEPLYARFKRRFPRLTASEVWRLWQVTRTFLLMGLIRSLDCYRSVGTTFSLWWSILTNWNFGELLQGGIFSFGLQIQDWVLLLLSACAIWLVSRLQDKEIPLRQRVADRPILWSSLACALVTVILLFGAYGIGYDASGFIYQQF